MWYNYPMKKAILKCKLENPDDFKRKLSDIEFNFSDTYWHHDRIYVPKNYQPKSNFPRLIMRTETKPKDTQPQFYLILKRHVEDSGLDITETTITDEYEKMVNIVFQLGFKFAAEISCHRQSLVVGEGTCIHLDKIDSLPGYYAKIESDITTPDSVTEAHLDIEKTFRTLGESNFIKSAYFEIS